MSTRTMERTDQEIQEDVVTELKWDARLQPNEITVMVRDGVVTLAGWVDSFTKKWAAERSVHRINGVRAVVNDVEVRLPGAVQRPDSDIAAAAVRALEWDVFVPDD
jgi:osmotically-inducible protein OsmY